VPRPLPLRPAPNSRETLPSFLARIAAMNGIGSVDFARDMGFSLKRIVNLEDIALDRLAEVGGLTIDQLEELVSWTGRGAGDVTKVFRGEIFGSRSIRNPVLRGCPICLREDAEVDLKRPKTKLVMHGDWQLRNVSICVRHQHPLVPLWESARPTDRYDFSVRLPEILPGILDGTFDRSRTKPSAYDLWLDHRMETGGDETWFADKSLYAATTFCQLLGTELLRLGSEKTRDQYEQHRLAQSLGFDVASRGAEEVRDALNSLAAIASGQNDEPKKAFGALFPKLNLEYVALDAFAPFREVLRDCIVDIWPIASGKVLLGVTQHERQLHSVHSAARETGISAFLLEPLLIHAGVIDQDDDRPLSRKTFDAIFHADLLSKFAAEIPTLVGPIEMQTAMGATRNQLSTLEADQVLVPRTDLPKIKFSWRLEDGLALVAELDAMAVSTEATDKRWETIQRAKSRSDLSVGKIIEAIRSGELKLGKFYEIVGYAGFCVLKVEVDELRQSRVDLVNHDLITAAAFGRQVGMRKPGWFEALAAKGHAPATYRPHPKFGGEWVFLTEENVEAFHRRFLTASTMAIEFGEDHRTLVRKLKAAGVTPFKPNDEEYGAIYLRRVVEAVLS
jgi:hypothetical protein